jgi:hypothetical protein
MRKGPGELLGRAILGFAIRPRRAPRLDRITRSAGFRQRHAAAWLLELLLQQPDQAASPDWKPRDGVAPPPGHDPVPPPWWPPWWHARMQGRHRIPPLPVRMSIGWISRNQRLLDEGHLPGLRRLKWSGPQEATSLFQPVEWSEADLPGLAQQALATHERAIAIRVELPY